MTGLYIHIPFCLSKCPYCDFYSVKYSKKAAQDYKNAVLRNLSYYGKKFGHKLKTNTAYFGGGTPILLWKEICEILGNIDFSENAEITLEANPCCSTEENLCALRKAGVNRVSFGVQSLDDIELKSLGRRHDAKTAINVIELAHRCGFENISADIMLGTEYQTKESVTRTIDRLSELPLTHISAYMLKIEENTPFAKRTLALPEEEKVCEIYLNTVQTLEKYGFKQYEISNFSKKGFACKHNLKYWNCEEYLGIGPAAHSFYDSKRFFVQRDLDEFLAADHQKTLLEEEHPADCEEYAMLRLRLNEGLDLNEYEKRGGNVGEALQNIKEIPRTLISFRNNILSLTAEGFLVSNAIIAKFLGY